MPPQTPDELLEAARALESQAIAVGEDGAEGRRLRAQAADLRRQALGPKVYPVLVCSSCLRITGWTSTDGRCDSCLRTAQLEASFANPHGGWVSVAGTRPPPGGDAGEAPPLAARISALLRRRSALDRAVAWMERVDPGRTGPIEPEDGFELETAEREEAEAADGSGILVRFSTVTRRYAGGRWPALESTRLGRSSLLVPDEFSAGLPMEQLAEAWADYRAEVGELNRAAWDRGSARREAEREAREAREQTLAEQRRTSELLDEDGAS
jgi:hypothetical protein